MHKHVQTLHGACLITVLVDFGMMASIPKNNKRCHITVFLWNVRTQRSRKYKIYGCSLSVEHYDTKLIRQTRTER